MLHKKDIILAEFLSKKSNEEQAEMLMSDPSTWVDTIYYLLNHLTLKQQEEMGLLAAPK